MLAAVPDPDDRQGVPVLVDTASQYVGALSEGDEKLPVLGAVFHLDPEMRIFEEQRGSLVDRQPSLLCGERIFRDQELIETINILDSFRQEDELQRVSAFLAASPAGLSSFARTP